MVKILALIITLSTILTGCAKTQATIQNSIDHKMLAGTIGKPYESLTRKTKLTASGLLGQDKVYGNFVSSYRLVDGGVVMRHVDRYKSGGSRASFGLPISIGSDRTAYRVFYFNVGKDGTVRDWASGFYNDSKASCIGVTGLGLSYCGKNKKELDFNQLDNIVKTSSGQPITIWNLTN
jgi:hypothetical protein